MHGLFGPKLIIVIIPPSSGHDSAMTIIIIIIIIIICYDLLPPLRKGSHVNSDYIHTVSNIHRLAHPSHQPQPSSLCSSRRSSRHPSNLTSSPHTRPQRTFHHHHPSSHTVLIHSLHVSKPSQYSLIHSTRQLPFYSNSNMHLFIPNSIHLWHSHQTSQTLHLKNIRIPSLSTSHAPRFCSV